VEFRRGDMRTFRLPETFGVATCLFDSLNHLGSVRELRSAFRSVAAHLEPGGFFIFDVNTLRCFELLWTSTQVLEAREFTLILQNSYSARRRSGTSLVTVFEKEGDFYRRSTERVRERWFTTVEVGQALEREGFAVVERRGFNFTPLRRVGDVKEWWVARRAG
jgi:SAM-dependent methyltransferase